MPRVILPLAFVILLLGMPARGDDDARAVIDRAVKAQGGETKLAAVRAVQLKIKGTIQAPEGALPFTALTSSQLPSQFRHDMVYDRGTLKVTQVQVYDDSHVSIRVDKQILNLDADLQAALLKGRYADRLAGLTLLKDKGFELKALGASKVEGREAVGVKVTAKEQPEVLLFFDKENGLLLKTEHRQLDPRTRQEAIQEVFYSDYRELDTRPADEQLLRAAKLGVDGPALLEYFRKLAGTGVDRERLLALIKQLGDEVFDAREKASAELVTLGALAVPFLKEALKDADIEVARRAERCLQQIEKDPQNKGPDPALPAAAARLLAARKPAGSAEVLLTFLLRSVDDTVTREVRAALAAVALPDGQPDQALVKALDDKDPRRRAAAAEALGRTPLPPGRKLILDGVRRPLKVAIYRAGRKFMDWEVTEVAYFNKLDDKLFIVP